MVTDDAVNGEQSEEDDVFLTPDSVVGSGPDETPLKVSKVDTVYDVLFELGMKPLIHLLKISIFSLNNVIIRPIKIIKSLCKASTKIAFIYWLYRGP